MTRDQADMAAVRRTKAAQREREAEPPKLKRCPTCGEPVASIFDHVDVDCLGVGKP